jgi:hypothetical protein
MSVRWSGEYLLFLLYTSPIITNRISQKGSYEASFEITLNTCNFHLDDQFAPLGDGEMLLETRSLLM